MSCEVSFDLFDPSEYYRPESKYQKPKNEFRNFVIQKDDPMQERVRKTYLDMHTNQCVDFVKEKLEFWTRFDKLQMNIMDALQMLNSFVDQSDPDVDVPNIIHAFQTAESIREAYPDHDWFHLTGLVHDLGKIMAFYGEKQWAVVGDTFPVGCAFAESIVYRKTSFEKNPDLNNPIYNTRLGIYQEKCGLNKVLMSWGHDEYLYQVLLNHKSKLPEQALYIIRYHSFYPWHSGGDYKYLCNDMDDAMLPWVQCFNKFDLYTKAEDEPDIDAIKPYYQKLVDKYIPGLINW